MKKKNYFKITYSQAFYHPLMLITLILCLCLCLWNFISVLPLSTQIKSVVEGIETYPLSMFRFIIGSNTTAAPSVAFYTLFPILAALPFGATMYDDIHSGWLKNILVRITMKDYLSVKRFLVFISGGVVLSIPFIFDFLLTGCFFPAILPDPVGAELLSDTAMFANLVYSAPHLYMFLFLIITFVFGGLYALLASYVGVFLTNKFAVYLCPFLLHMFFSYLAQILNLGTLSPIYLLAPTGSIHHTSLLIYILYGLFLAAIIFILHRLCVKREKII